MIFFYLFLLAGLTAAFALFSYNKQHKQKVATILRDNKNVPPLFMLRSAELKVNAIKAAIHAGSLHYADVEDEAKKTIAMQLEGLIASYNSRQIALSTYYAKLGALLINVYELKGIPVEM